jgi:hypothetical protein
VLSPAQRAADEMVNSRIIIYAVKPFAWKDRFPAVNTVDVTYSREVEAKWHDKLAFLRDRA